MVQVVRQARTHRIRPRPPIARGPDERLRGDPLVGLVLFLHQPGSQSRQLVSRSESNRGGAVIAPKPLRPFQRELPALWPREISPTVSAETADPGYAWCCGSRKDWLPGAGLDSREPEDPRWQRREPRWSVCGRRSRLARAAARATAFPWRPGVLLLVFVPRLTKTATLSIAAVLLANVLADLAHARRVGAAAVKGDWELALVFAVVPARMRPPTLSPRGRMLPLSDGTNTPPQLRTATGFHCT